MRRELREETGLHVGALELIAQKSGDWRGVNHEFIYYRAATEHVEVSLSEEHSKFEWHHPLIAGTMIKYVPHLMGLLATNHHNTDVH
jgi:8-oxo-dGTP pyrophosphatase MutT (NUDIX family)